MLIGSLLELMGIVAIMPFVKVISNVEIIHYDSPYYIIYDILGLSSDSKFIMLFAVALIVLYIIKNIYIIAVNYFQYRFTFNNQQSFINVMMDCYMKQSYAFHLSKNVSKLQHNVTSDVTGMFAAVLAIIQMVNEIVICSFIFTYLFVLDKSIMIGLLIMMSCFALFFFLVIRKKTYQLGAEYREQAINFSISTRQAFEGIKEIKIVNREKFYINEVQKYSKNRANIDIMIQTINAIPRPLFEAVCVSGLLGIVTIKIARGVNLTYFIPVVSAFAVGAFRILPSVGRISSFLNVIMYNKASIDDLYDDLREVEELSTKFVDRFTNKENVTFNDRISVNNVAFGYSETSDYVLDGASLEIKKNTSVALIGQSGSGKTTMADVILGLLEPKQGHIYCDDIDVYERPYGWHKLLGYIPQTIYLVDDTIKNNVLFGIPDDEADDERVWKAIEDAQLEEFVKSLEKGIDTVVGERGVRLSGGQRQRIGIARALYNDPQILVLDEATSALDNDTEAAVMDAINALHGNTTMIIIAHRLTTIRNCDYIYEVKDGKIVPRNKCEVLADIS